MGDGAVEANLWPEHDIDLARHDMRNCREEIVRLRARCELLQSLLRALIEGITE